MSDLLDLGHDHYAEFFIWDPDVELNPQYESIADHLPIDPAGAHIWHPAPDGSECREHYNWREDERLDGLGLGSVTFHHELLPDSIGKPGQRWTLINFDPLTIAPSVLCRACGDHGFVRESRWDPA